MKNIVFRADSSTQIGSGHVMRCLTLAEQLSNKANISFVCRDLAGNISYLIKEKGYELHLLPRHDNKVNLTGYLQWLTVEQDVDAEEMVNFSKHRHVDYLIIDHYAIDYVWESRLRSFVDQIMVIDDLANRKHDCDILLDQNYYQAMHGRYKGLVSPQCRLLLGPQYVLLRDEFRYREKQRKRHGNINNILVFFGGSDISNETMKTLQVIHDLQLCNLTVNVVVGACNPHYDELRLFCSRLSQFHCFWQTNRMAELMNQSDLIIGAGGTTTWERCFLGIPSIVIAIADNQIAISQDCFRLGAIEYLGLYSEVSSSVIKKAIFKLMNDKVYYQKMMCVAKTLVDGLGVERIRQHLFCGET